MRWIGAVLVVAALVAGCGTPLPPTSPGIEASTSVGAEPVSPGAAATPDGAPGIEPLSRTGDSGASPSSHSRESEATARLTTGVTSASGGRSRDSTAVDETLSLLRTLPVKGRAPKTGYDRALFGTAWTDDVTVDGGHNGCDTRNDILRRDLTGAVVKAGTYGCLVLSGTLHDVYTGRTIAFVRGQVTSQAVQIDHVVALMDAWQKGAQQLSTTERRNLANDPLNLQAVDGPTNERKGAGDAATWLPPNKGYRCVYVARQVAVKARYRLWVTQAERDAIGRVLASCATGMMPSASIPTPVPSTADSAAAPQTTSATPLGTTARPATTPAAARTSATATTPAMAPASPATTAAAAQPGGCFPRSKAGNCYNAGQTCAKKSHGESGVAGNGRAIKCVDDSGIWRWTYA